MFDERDKGFGTIIPSKKGEDEAVELPQHCVEEEEQQEEEDEDEEALGIHCEFSQFD